MSSRIPEIDPRDYTEEQAALAERIIAKRGGVRGPYKCWLHSPQLCDRVEALGAYVRFESSLPAKFSDLSLLICARWFDAPHSWHNHYAKAVELGLDPAALDAIAENRTPRFPNEDEQVFWDFCHTLLNDHFVSDEQYNAMVEHFGTQGVVDTIGQLGNFSMLAMCMNTFTLPLDPGKPDPYPDIAGYARNN